MEQNIRTILAALLSMLIIIGWQHFFVSQEVKHKVEEEIIEEREYKASIESTVEDGFKNDTRVAFTNDFISGSINLVGAQIDDLILKKYNDADQKNVLLLKPGFSSEPNFIKIGWKVISKSNQNQAIELPTSNTIWTLEEHSDRKIVVFWKSSQNILFKINIALDDIYLFNIKTTVDLSESQVQDSNIKIRAYVSMQRSRNALIADSMILHEGPIGVVDGQLKEIDFAKVKADNYKFTKNDKIEWFGFSDKYWLVTFIPADHEGITGSVSSVFSNEWNQEKFNIDLLLKSHQLDEQIISDSFMIFAGAKSIEVLDAYQKSLNISMFDRAVDLGFLYFITKPIFLLLNYFYKILGNFGLAIMLLTILTKILLFPLAYKSVKSMNRIKRIQPKIQKLKMQYEGNTMQFQQALVSLYKKEKVNPAAGCLPIVLQMPIFFALYKVLYVTIEMRNAPFFLWINDLSAPDPTSLFNLFGLVPWQPPVFLMIGVLPLLMSLTMFIQQSLNPQPTDQVPAMMMKMMPLMLLFMFAQFPSGLLLYWTWSNIISIIQQIVIKYLPE